MKSVAGSCVLRHGMHNASIMHKIAVHTPDQRYMDLAGLSQHDQVGIDIDGDLRLEGNVQVASQPSRDVPRTPRVKNLSGQLESNEQSKGASVRTAAIYSRCVGACSSWC